MIGKNILLLAQEDGHSVQTMLTTYAAWTKGSAEVDIENIKRAMERSPEPVYARAESEKTPLEAPGFATRLPLDEDVGPAELAETQAETVT